MTSTPRLTHHARERCAEMGLSTKVAKAIVQRPTMTYPSRSRDGHMALIATSVHVPEYAVVFLPEDPPLILTVVFREQRTYVRDGESYITD